MKRLLCVVLGHFERVESMTRNGTWHTAPTFPREWAGTRPSVRLACGRCGKVLRG